MRYTHACTQPFNSLWSGTTRVSRYQKKHSPTHTHPVHQTSFINFLHLLRSMASSLFSLRAWESCLTTSLQVLFGLPLGLGPSTSYSMHFFTQSSSSFCSTCPYQRSLFWRDSTTQSLNARRMLVDLFISLFSRTTWISWYNQCGWGKKWRGFGDGSSISWTTCKQHRQITTPTPHQSIFTGQILFLTPNQQCQSTEGC